jgi:hypothetical protein
MDVDPQKVIERLLDQNRQLLLQVSMLQVAVEELQKQQIEQPSKVKDSGSSTKSSASSN